MTTRPKARKFRIRRGGTAVLAAERAAKHAAAATAAEREAEETAPDTAAPQEQPASKAPESAQDSRPSSTGKAKADTPAETQEAAQAFADTAQTTTAQTATPRPATPPVSRTEEEIARALEAIRQEGLTGRQLRMARRTALREGIKANSDFDAVRQLRERGIDPFARKNMLELVVGDENAQGAAAAGGAVAAQTGTALTTQGQTMPAETRPAQLPQTTPGALPLDEASRATEIMRVQRDIARRRKRRLMLLAARLACFVLLPTLILGFYYFRIATPLYATNTEFVIQKAEAAGGGAGGLGGILGGTGFATAQESITVQSFLQSREAMLRLDEEHGFREHFSDPDLDPLIRLAPDASIEDMYDTYRRHLSIGYDPTEGLIRMEVVAADPATSQAFSEALIAYAEERVDQMSARLRGDQMAGARESYEEAEERMIQAQQRVIDLQEQRGVLSAEAEVSTVFQQISTFELQLREERLRLAELLSVERPNRSRVEVAEQNIARLEALIEDLRSGLTTGNGEEVSLARISSELVVAEADLETRQLILAQALQQLETARIEANRQSLYLSVGVFPVQPDEPAYPRAFENTVLAFLVFSGIYLMLSMTAAILREQVSA